jgi:ATP sulfurylase
MIDKEYFPKNKFFINAFSTYSRYSGAREAVFTALCRKNFGCSHFIIGRDHTGVGNFYASNASQELFESLGNTGTIPIFFDEIKYCPSCSSYAAACVHDDSDRRRISGTQVRAHLTNGEFPPDWMMRPEISEMILEHQSQGKEIFVS